MSDPIRKLNQEELQEILENSMSFSEFSQYVKYNIPYDEYVFGVGKVSYMPLSEEDKIVLIPDDGTGDLRQNPFYWDGVAFNGFSLYKSWIAFDKDNLLYWKGVNGKRYSKSLVSNPFENYKSKNFYLNSAKKAAEAAKPLYWISEKISYVGLIIPVSSTIIKGKINLEDTTDFVFAAVVFIPLVGWIISGIYFVADTACVIVTGEKISTQVEKRAFTRWVKFQNELKNWLNGFVPIGYGHF